jgi:transposase
VNKYTSRLINLPDYRIINHKINRFRLVFWLKSTLKHAFCLKCNTKSHTVYETKTRFLKHEFWNKRNTKLFVFQRRFKCRSCNSRFWEILPGVKKYARRTEALKKQIATDALAGYNNKSVSKKFNCGQATVQRYVQNLADLELRKRSSALAPRILGIDEHFFTRSKGYATTIADLERKKIFDITLGRSELALEAYLKRLQCKSRTEYIVMDLSSTYRSIAKKYFPNAQIITDRFHVIRLVNQRFLETWKMLDPKGRKNIGLVSLFRRHPSKLSKSQQSKFHQYLQSRPGLEALYSFKNRLCRFLNYKSLQFRFAKNVFKYFFYLLELLRKSGFLPLISLANTLDNWHEEILRMLKHTKSNAVTEGFHNIMKREVRIAVGFRNFKNYRQRVLLKCS